MAEHHPKTATRSPPKSPNAYFPGNGFGDYGGRDWLAALGVLPETMRARIMAR